MEHLWGKQIPYLEEEIDFIPEITPYLAQESNSAVIVCPGGAYAGRAEHEGPVIAKWLNQIGISAFVLDYRVAPYQHPAEISDGIRAVRYVRYHAERLGIDPHKIAIMGFSAGGHLAASVSVHYEKNFYEPTDAIDKVDARPDATILCYPVIDMFEYRHDGSRTNLLGQNPAQEEKKLMALQQQITKATPPAFLWHTSSDQAVPVENSLMYAAGLSQCKVPFELHVYPVGEHGLGLASELPHTAQWSQALERWFVLNSFI